MGQETPHDADPVRYVEVANEPLHREVYGDGYFRVYIADLPPGQATRYHRHSEDTVYLVIKGGRMSTVSFKGYKRSPMVFPRAFPFYKKIWFALQNVFIGSVHLPDGLFFFMPTREHPSIHMAAASPRNREEVSLMGIELRRRRAGSHPPLIHDSLPWRAEYDDGSLKVLVHSLAPAASGRIALPGHRLFMVCVKGPLDIICGHALEGEGEFSRLAVGDYLCISGDAPALARNPGTTTSELVIFAHPTDAQWHPADKIGQS